VQVVRHLELPLLGGRNAAIVQAHLPPDEMREPDEGSHVPVVLLVDVGIIRQGKGDPAREAAEDGGPPVDQVGWVAANGKLQLVVIVVAIIITAAIHDDDDDNVHGTRVSGGDHI